MFLFKLKNNNKAYSSVSWCVLFLITIVCLSTLLDLVNLSTVKNTLIQRVNYLANIGTLQGGFGSSAPYGWGNNMVNAYVSAGTAQAYFTRGFSGKKFCTGAKVSGLNTVAFQGEGVITGQVNYIPIFTKKLTYGVASSYTLTHSARFCGFWIYKSTTV